MRSLNKRKKGHQRFNKCNSCKKYKRQRQMHSLYECINCFEVKFLESHTDDGSWVGR